MRSLATHHPFLFAMAITLVGTLCLLLPFWLPGLTTVAQVLLGRVTLSLLAAGLLIWLGWWREASFVRPHTWRIAIPYLPVLLVILLNVMPA